MNIGFLCVRPTRRGQPFAIVSGKYDGVLPQSHMLMQIIAESAARWEAVSRDATVRARIDP
ncbi:MAG: hypothetical protein Q8M18_20380 [Bradyrhizobium sp.]|nr:hypothetical protein [Bradyrhizobium sp.]